jgi:hypothetical protein
MDPNENRPPKKSAAWWDEDQPLPQPEPKPGNEAGVRRADWKPPGWMTFSLIVLLVVLVGAVTYLRDEKPPWEVDLMDRSTVEEIPDIRAPIRMKAMLHAATKINFSTLEGQPPWEWSTPALSQALEVHSAVLDNLRDLIEENESEWKPNARVWRVEDLGSRPEWAKIMLLKQAEVAYLDRRGEEESAILAATDMTVLASLLEGVEAWPSFTQRTMELQESAAQSIALLLKETHLPEPVLTRLQFKEFGRWAPSEAGLSHAMNGFYMYERKLIMGPLEGEPALPAECLPANDSRFLFKPNATLHLFADSFRELKDQAALAPFARVDQIGSRANHLRLGGGGLGTPNQTGSQYFAARIQSYIDLLDKHSLARARHAIIMTLFAIHRCMAKEGRLPQTLDELTPAYLPEKLYDPFSNDPLHYDPVRGIIYSVGSNLKDDGGKPTPIPFADATEPTAEIGLKVAKAVKPGK